MRRFVLVAGFAKIPTLPMDWLAVEYPPRPSRARIGFRNLGIEI